MLFGADVLYCVFNCYDKASSVQSVARWCEADNVELLLVQCSVICSN